MSTPYFQEVELDPLIGYGTKAGLSYVSTVVSNPARKETRFAQQSRGYWNFEISFKDKSKGQILAIQNTYSLVQGKVYGFRFLNYREYYTCLDDFVGGIGTLFQEPITTYAGGTTMQLIHTRRPGTSTAEIVLIRKPFLNGSIFLFRDGSGSAWPNTNYTIDLTTGIVTFNVDQTGHTFEWAGQWDTPVRFDTDDADIEQSDFDVFAWESIKLREIQV